MWRQTSLLSIDAPPSSTCSSHRRHHRGCDAESLFDGVGSSERPERTCRLCNWLHMLLLLTFDVKNIILIITSYDRRNTRILFSQPGTKTVSDSYRKQRRFAELDLETWIPGNCSREQTTSSLDAGYCPDAVILLQTYIMGGCNIFTKNQP